MEDFSDTDFLVVFPIWFLVDERATEVKPNGFRELVERDWRAFCGGMVGSKKCVTAFTDHDLAERHIRENNFDSVVPIGTADAETVTKLLSGWHPKDFDAVLLDPGRDRSMTRNVISIPDFIERLKHPE